MRIIAGIRRGMSLAVPRGNAVRPTADRVRGAIFSRLGDRVGGATVLDLFAGTGALGLEAASRGAAAVTFVEQSRIVLETLQVNLARFSRNPQGDCLLTVLHREAFVALHKLSVAGQSFSLIFADPPYGEAAQALLEEPALGKILASDGCLVLESDSRRPLAAGEWWALDRESVYGDTRVSFLRRPA